MTEMRDTPTEDVSKTDARISRVERLTLRMSIIQTFIAVTGFFVALVALYAALNESDAVRKQQQASVWPNLEFQMSYLSIEGDERLEILLQNTGIGPAKVEKIEFMDGEVPLINWTEVTSLFSKQTDQIFSLSSVSGRVLRPGQNYSLFSVGATEMKPEIIRAMRDAVVAERIVGQLCYCSVFDECWTLDSRSLDPEPIITCSTSDNRNGF